jgi:hypothetical protein
MPLVRENTLLYEVVKVSTIDGDPLAVVNGLSVPEHDYIALTYTSSNLTGVVYKTGGSGGTTVATLVLTYDGSNNLTSVTKS